MNVCYYRLALGLLLGLLSGLYNRLLNGLVIGLATGLGIVLTTLLTTIGTGLTAGEIEMKTAPNQGIWRSARNALRVGSTIADGWIGDRAGLCAGPEALGDG